MIENFKDIGNRIAQKLDELNLRQVDVCKATGLSKNAISNYINSNRVPDTMAAYKLARLFAVSIEWLLTGEDSKIPITHPTPDEQVLLKLFHQLTNQNQVRIIERMETLMEMQDEKGEISSTYTNGDNELCATSDIIA